MEKELYFEDFEPAQEFSTDSFTLSEEHSRSFAAEYDPQYFHVDPVAAEKSVWGKLVASGWHTAAITMKLKAASQIANVKGGLVGMGIDSVRWPRPVYPGDTLHAVITVLEKRRSNSQPMFGIVNYKVETFNQHQELVMEMKTAVWVPCRNKV